MKTFTFHIDPGHGWLKVTTGDCLDIGLFADNFSRYSYQRNHELFLEEDCDAAKFIRAYRAKHGVIYIKECHTSGQSFIRRLPRVNTGEIRP
jgi:hypothetical protein